MTGSVTDGRPMLETANVMFTDTVDSTSTLTRIGADAAETERHRHDTIVANVVTVFGGRVVKSTGDGAVALLPSADHLVRAGSAVQEAAAAEGIALRVGVSTGDVVSEHGDCFGEAVVVASRLCAAVPAWFGLRRCHHRRRAWAPDVTRRSNDSPSCH